jgi:hypothetical protein
VRRRDHHRRLRAGTGTARLSEVIHNQGTVEVSSGTLTLRAGGSSPGVFSVVAPGTLDFGGGVHTLEAGSSVSGSGTVSASYGTVDVHGAFALTGTNLVNSGTINFHSPAGATVGTLLVVAGKLGGNGSLVSTETLDWRGGKISGWVRCAGGTLSGGGANLSGGRLVNAGRLVFTAAANQYLQIGGGGLISNLAGATFELTADGSIRSNGEAGTRTIHNEGLLLKSGGTSASGVFATLENLGTVEVRSGALSLFSPYTQSAGATRLLGGGLNASLGVTLEGGILEGTNLLTGNVTNRAIVRPGVSPGQLQIKGNYTQKETGVLQIELGGPEAGSGSDRLAVSGTVTLAGTLNVSLVNGFAPPLGSAYDILTAGTCSGTFQVVEVPAEPSLAVSYQGNGVALTATTATQPPPLQVAVNPGDSITMSWPEATRRYVLETTFDLKGDDSTAWMPVSPSLLTTNHQTVAYSETLSRSGNKFYRLREDRFP